jgi:hypothetical protein
VTETEKYIQLSKAVVNLRAARRGLPWWRRVLRLPSPELEAATDALHAAIGTVSAHVEFCTCADRERLVIGLTVAEWEFREVLRRYGRLNHWGYWMEYPMSPPRLPEVEAVVRAGQLLADRW